MSSVGEIIPFRGSALTASRASVSTLAIFAARRGRKNACWGVSPNPAMPRSPGGANRERRMRLQTEKRKSRRKAAKGNNRAALSIQQTIPYLAMHPDGVCKLSGGLYTKTVEYEDINYSVASTEDQTAIFGG